MALQLEEFSNSVAVKETLIDTDYVGTHTQLKGSSGKAYYNLQKKFWAYRPDGHDVFYKIKVAHHLDCNTEMSWIRCTYVGSKNIGKQGKASFSEGEDAWIYKPDGKSKTFIIREDADLKFKRDRDI